MIKPIETRYAGHRFRSRLEARWAVFFDEMAIPWQYEPQGFLLDGRPYLPDFLLTDSGTWVEVKGSTDGLDMDLLHLAARRLPAMGHRCEAGPRLLLLGPIPAPCPAGDWGWLSVTSWPPHEPEPDPGFGMYYGFGNYQKNLRPWCLYNVDRGRAVTYGSSAHDWLTPILDETECGVPEAYKAARSARFEHGDAS